MSDRDNQRAQEGASAAASCPLPSYWLLGTISTQNKVVSPRPPVQPVRINLSNHPNETVLTTYRNQLLHLWFLWCRKFSVHISDSTETSYFGVLLCVLCVCVFCFYTDLFNSLFISASLGAVMWQRIHICCALFALYSAAPLAHINRLALFPDKSAWCEAKNITQIVGHAGCQPRSIQNRSGQRSPLSHSPHDWYIVLWRWYRQHRSDADTVLYFNQYQVTKQTRFI